MSAKWQKIDIEIPRHLGPQERQALAIEIIDHIRKRTDKGVDKNGSKFPKYSKSYTESLDFKIAGKSKSKVDLQLSGDMLGALDLLNHQPGKIVIGFERGSDENARADGNIRGTYGKNKADSSKARDFLGLSKTELATYLRKYPAKDKDASKKRASTVLNQSDADVETDNLESDGE